MTSDLCRGRVGNHKKRSEDSEYRPLCSGPAHWIPACAGMTGYGLHRGSTRPKAGFQTASKSCPYRLRKRNLSLVFHFYHSLV